VQSHAGGVLDALFRTAACNQENAMAYVVRAFPLIRPAADLQAFLTALSGPKRDEATKFYHQYGVSHESAYIQDTVHGKLLIVVTVIRDGLEAAPRYQNATEEFHSWFKGQVLHLTGVDPNVMPLGPPTTQVFSWSAAPRDVSRL
jgi:hypothetical protein